jgi:hypothetical protein
MQTSSLFGSYRLEYTVDQEVADALAPIRQLRTAGRSYNGNWVRFVDRQFLRVKVAVGAY